MNELLRSLKVVSLNTNLQTVPSANIFGFRRVPFPRKCFIFSSSHPLLTKCYSTPHPIIIFAGMSSLSLLPKLTVLEALGFNAAETSKCLLPATNTWFPAAFQYCNRIFKCCRFVNSLLFVHWHGPRRCEHFWTRPRKCSHYGNVLAVLKCPLPLGPHSFSFRVDWEPCKLNDRKSSVSSSLDDSPAEHPISVHAARPQCISGLRPWTQSAQTMNINWNNLHAPNWIRMKGDVSSPSLPYGWPTIALSLWSTR